MDSDKTGSVAGSCLCGTVRWRARQPLAPLMHCHCSMCRKAHGAPFASFTSAKLEDFEWVSGEDSVRRYASSPEVERPFCAVCGSAVPGLLPAIGQAVIPAGALDDDPGLRGGVHVFLGSKPAWSTVDPALEGHDAYPPGPPWDAFPVIERAAPPAPEPGLLRGGCLCGAVAFWVRPPFLEIHNCHCSRCRKARAAAHTTNGFVPVDALRFLSGEDRLRRFRPAGARRFTHVFCEICGSGLPRAIPEAGIASIPLGALDDDPGRPADDHIWVSSMAPWYAIPDDLPRFPGDPS